MLPYPDIDPVAVSLGPIQVHWYGLAYLAGLAFAWWLGVRRSRRPDVPLSREQVDDLIFFSALGVVLAAATLFLVSPGSAYITGQVLHVNGGMYT